MRLRHSAALALAGLGLLAAAAARSPAATDHAGRQGGTLRVNVSNTDIDYADPALAYDFLSWQIEAATCAKLLNYPDLTGPAGARLRPEVAASMPSVSATGRIYSFTVRSGYRFNTGTPVTAASFVRAFERALTPKMQSPASTFVGDIAGADAFAKGRAKTISGVQTSGNRLVIRLARPAADFLARVAMPFFCAVPSDLPIDPQGVNTVPAAGPYYVASKIANRAIVLRRNQYYRGPRPRRLDEIQLTVNTNLNQSYLQVQRGEADYDAFGLPPAAHAELERRYGVNRGRYFVHPTMSVIYIALNTSRPLFSDVNMRRAVNFAVDRRVMLRVAGLNAGALTDQILPPSIPGFENAQIYPGSPNVARAKQLTGGQTAKAVLYSGNDPISTKQAVIVQANLKAIGIGVEIKQFPFAVQVAKSGRRGEPFDLNLIGWFADYPDPSDFINLLLDGSTIQAANNVNWAYFDDPEYNRKLAAAAKLTGNARYRAYGALDVDIMRNAVPWAPVYNATVREYVSSRVGCYQFHAVWGSLNYAAACLR
jgi:peptide/nickel transport system substrate-binding protein